VDTIRFFKNYSKTHLKAARDTGDDSTLQQVQHRVAQTAGYSSWGALLVADEIDRRLAAVMFEEPTLNLNGIGPGPYPGTPQERRERSEAWRRELRARSAHVHQIRAWLEDNIEPRKTINSWAGSYGLKHIAENALGAYVSNGELIAAAIIAGFPYRLEGGRSPNVYFGMRAASIKAARTAAETSRRMRHAG